jgi:hypothetical protein
MLMIVLGAKMTSSAASTAPANLLNSKESIIAPPCATPAAAEPHRNQLHPRAL